MAWGGLPSGGHVLYVIFISTIEGIGCRGEYFCSTYFRPGDGNVALPEEMRVGRTRYRVLWMNPPV